MNNGHWQYPTEIDPTKYVGFIYRIDCLKNGMSYIGRKQFWSTRRVKVKGRKNRKVKKSESNWREYTSSSTHLNKDITAFGNNSFQFTIIQLCENKSQMAYYEPYYMFKYDVLTKCDPQGKRIFYNRQIPACKCIPKL